MSTEQAFLDAIGANPGDDVNRLVYADWLDERGDGRAAYLRREVELAALDESHEDYQERQRELQSLREGIDPVWLAQAGKPFDLWLLGYLPPLKIRVIKIIRELTGVSLVEAKLLSEKRPSAILRAVPRSQAEEARRQLYGDVQTAIRPAFLGTGLLPAPSLPGYALRLLECEDAAWVAARRAILHLRPMSLGESKDLAERPRPVVLHVFPSKYEALTAADLFLGFAQVDVQRVESAPSPATYPPCGAFSVVLQSFSPEKKIEVMQAIRAVTRCDLTAAKARAEGSLPVVLAANLDWWTALRGLLAFESCAEAEIRES